MKFQKFFYLMSIFTTVFAKAWAVTPMDYYNTVVAGRHDGGYRDGAFSTALFSTPSDMAFDESGQKIYVADTENHRIRVVDLVNHNVQTVAGTGEGGAADGTIEKARFYRPFRLCVLPQKRLAVYDSGNNLMRLIDLNTKSVSTIPIGLFIENMVYRSQDDSLYFSEPTKNRLGKLDLKTSVVSTVLLNNEKIMVPSALCLNQDKLYIADGKSSGVYEMDFSSGKSLKDDPILKQVGQGSNIKALAFSEGVLYALQTGTIPLVRVRLPASTPVGIATQFGFLVDFKYAGVEPFLVLQDNQPIGFVASPVESRKLYISGASILSNGIISVKDYDFDKTWTVSSSENRPGALSDFNYPAKKPRGAYRILVVGDTRTNTAIRLGVDVGDKAGNGTGTFRTDTFPKQLEVFLNTDESLENGETHFEVLTLSRPDKALSDYVDDEVPVLAKKYDVDLVLGLAGEIDVKKGSEDSTAAHLTNLSKKLGDFKTSQGTSFKMAVVYVPSLLFHNDETEPAWKELCAEHNFNLIDLTEAFDGLKTSYYPTNQKGTEPAYTAYGSELVANILSRYLEMNQVIPFSSVKK